MGSVAALAQLVAPTRRAVGVPTGASGSTRMAWVHILRTESGGFYVGSTENLSARLKHHFRGATPSTKRMHATSLALAQEYDTLKNAREIEKRIKKLKRHDYIEKMLKDGYIRLSPR